MSGCRYQIPDRIRILNRMLKYPARSDRARFGQIGPQQSAMIRIDMTQRPGGSPNLASEPPSWTILDSLSGESKATDVAVKPSRLPAARQPLSLPPIVFKRAGAAFPCRHGAKISPGSVDRVIEQLHVVDEFGPCCGAWVAKDVGLSGRLSFTASNHTPLP